MTQVPKQDSFSVDWPDGFPASWPEDAEISFPLPKREILESFAFEEDKLWWAVEGAKSGDRLTRLDDYIRHWSKFTDDIQRALSMLVEGGTKWWNADPNEIRTHANAEHRRRIAQFRSDLILVMRAIWDDHAQLQKDWENGYADQKPNPMKKAYLIRNAVDELNSPDKEFEAGMLAQKILNRGQMPPLPSVSTMVDEEHWFGGWTIEQMIGLEAPPDSGSGI